MERYISLSEVQRKISKVKQRICNHCLDGAVAMDYVDIILDDEFTDKTPAVDVKKKVYSKWIKHSGSDAHSGYGIEYLCENCSEWVKEKSKFCPNCGAEMKEF